VKDRPLILLALLAGVVVYALTDAYSRGHADGMADGASSRVRAYTHIVRKVDTMYVRDTVRFARWRDRWDSVRVTDTVTVRDVVYVPRDVADSTISACRLVIASCESRVAARDTLILALRGALKAEQSSKPSALRVALDRAVWASAGLGVGFLAGAVR